MALVSSSLCLTDISMLVIKPEMLFVIVGICIADMDGYKVSSKTNMEVCAV